MNQNYGNNHGKKQISKPVGCLIAVCILGVAFMLFAPFFSALIHMYKISPIRGKAIFWGIIVLIIGFTTIKIRKLYRLHKAVENGTAIRKMVKIIDFRFANKSGGEDETTYGYYVIASDGQYEYKGMFHRGAKIIGKLEGKTGNKKNIIEPYHLHTYEGNFYIGDGYTVLIDPDNPNNYIFERDCV